MTLFYYFQARYHCEVFRNCMLLLLMMQMTISILLTVNQIILAPPTLTISSSLWLVTIITPAIAITTLGNPLDVSIMKDAQGKNVTSLSTKVNIVWEEKSLDILHSLSFAGCS